MVQQSPDSGYGYPEEQPATLSIQEYLSAILRGKWIILVSVGVLLLVMIVYTIITKSVYEATSSVLINMNQGSGFSISDANKMPSENKIANELGQLKSRMMAEEVAKSLMQNPYMDPAKKTLWPILQAKSAPTDTTQMIAGMNSITTKILKSMDFSPERESDIVRITARSAEPRESAVLANIYAEVYQEHDLSSGRSRSRSLREFLQTQLASKQHSLDSAENSLKGYMQSSGVVSLDAQAQRVTQQLSQLEANRDAIDIDLESLTKTLATYQQRLPEQEREVGKVMKQASDPYIKLLQEQLANLQVQRDVLANQDLSGVGKEVYTEKLKSIEGQLANLQKKLDERTVSYLQNIPSGEIVAAAADPAGYLAQAKQKIFETQMQIQALQARKVALNNVIRQYETDFSAIPRKSIDFARLQRSRESAQKLYLMVEQKFNEAAIGEKSEFGYVDIIDTAVVPAVPVAPNLSFNLLIGIFLGLGMGVAIVFVREYLDVRINTPENLKKLNYPMLSYVTRMGGKAPKQQTVQKVRMGEKEYPGTLVALTAPFSAAAESYRRLRSKLEYLLPEDRIRSVVFTSPNPGEGKSTTVANLAIAFAQAERRVLVLDADLRRPTLHEIFGFNLTPGLSEVLTGQSTLKQAVHVHVMNNIDLLSAGKLSTKDPEILGSKHMKMLLEEIQKGYDWVILDSSPILPVSDAAALSTMTDGAVMVVSGGETRAVALERAAEFLVGAGGTMLGVFLNNFDAREAYGGFFGSDRYGYYNASYGKSDNGRNGEDGEWKKNGRERWTQIRGKVSYFSSRIGGRAPKGH